MTPTGTLTIRDDALWAKHVAASDIRDRILGLPPNAALRLRIDGRPIRFRKMRDGRDGRPTPGLRVDPDDAAGRVEWCELQARRGETVSLTVDEPAEVDPYLRYLDELFWKWNTPEDCAAFDDLSIGGTS